jgi:transcriptional regulator with XRE-family HTH domain
MVAIQAIEALRKWMSEEEKNQEALAGLLGVDQGLVSKWLNGKRRPNADHRVQIEVLTGKKVPFALWSKLTRAKIRKSEKAA